MPHLPTLFAAAAVVLGLALTVEAKAAPLPVASALATEAGAKSALPVEKVHRRYRYWGLGPRYNYWGPRYYYQPYYYYRPYPYYGYRYWGRPYRYWW